ncbi:DUF4236 domain-containing protein [Fusobacterium pseudoperiodonticum]|uniref:DUF4236 domain-containing protein n=1 Tax=Fusobacterium pseudoperiodonticum TaxID=2663009 RepID=A0AAD0ANM8_9FUSO|nr:DUF4236 domain-containing protein [Fusobacterium pseudoperiodonticum]ATV34643.1 hypothetical protein CTM64_00475 [Fusobacterium pseudoperiodonticum]ATV62464.1 hypothetical protein CTM74_11840 [Fusobacterium pseudoperiodonticum]DAS31630.1 MAG TPA: Protein of unknown function (DUF4236) [Caudoviricetes sp.]
MGFSFRKRLKIMKGLYLNFSKNGISTSVGGPGATLNFGKNGTRVTTSIPGTGIRYSKNLSGNKKDIASDFQDESNSVLTIDNYNFTGKVPKDANKNFFYLSIIFIILGIIFQGIKSFIITIPIFLYVFFIQLGKEEKRIDYELELIENENQIIRNKLKKLLKKVEAVDLMLEVNDCRTLKDDMEEIKTLFNELSKYSISYFIDEDKFFKLMAKAEEKNQNYYEALRLSTIVLHQYKPTKEIKKVLANSLNKLNINMKLEDYLDFVDNNSYTTVLEKIDELTNNTEI